MRKPLLIGHKSLRYITPIHKPTPSMVFC